jgi:hypothetical protein
MSFSIKTNKYTQIANSVPVNNQVKPTSNSFFDINESSFLTSSFVSDAKVQPTENKPEKSSDFGLAMRVQPRSAADYY